MDANLDAMVAASMGRDFGGSYDSIDAAIVAAPIGEYGDFGEAACDWYHVVDMETGLIVAKDTRTDL